MDHAMVRGLILVSLLAAITFAWQFARVGDFELLWLTPDQQARRAYDGLEFKEAYEQFEDPAWKGVAAYDSGLYEESAAAFGRIPTTVGFYNRGNAFMKARDYGKAIVAYEQAVAEAPDWVEARENLELADYVFDNTKDRGLEMEITDQSTIEMESAEKWMRGVDTETSDFLRTRFLLEATREGTR
jgi:Ca-activated chloride channel family protein